MVRCIQYRLSAGQMYAIGKLDRDASIHWLDDFVMINRCRSRATPVTRPFGPEWDLRLLFVLDSWYVARGRTDARRKEIGM